MPLKKILNEDQRLVILRFLSEDDDYKLNDSNMQTALEAVGHGMSRDKVLGHFAWLEEQALVTLEQPFETCTNATITQRGLDVAEGRTRHPGVKRPSPRS